ncbi:ATP-binding protein [Chitinophaga sp. GbtcB8]|nr:ATP-binding protein [Chitinophaga sp. GbtcB8]
MSSIQAGVEKTAWVLVNLLTIAIRYSPAGSAVQLTITQTADTLTFSV